LQRSISTLVASIVTLSPERQVNVMPKINTSCLKVQKKRNILVHRNMDRQVYCVAANTGPIKEAGSRKRRWDEA
jgi:hypothetical protein